MKIQLFKAANFTDFCNVCQEPIKWAPASVNFRNFAELYIATIPSLAKDASLSNLAILLILRRSFQWCRRIFPNWSIKKVEKTVKRSIVSKKKKLNIECFHMTSRRPYWCSKTMNRRPCWCPKPILWELNSFLMQTLSFVPINLHRCWPREWKHSIGKTTATNQWGQRILDRPGSQKSPVSKSSKLILTAGRVRGKI